MSFTPSYDPKTKQHLKDQLYKLIYDPVELHFKKRLEEIIRKNTHITRARHNSFSYKGVLYTDSNDPPPLKQNRLDPLLKPEMDKYLKEVMELNNEELPFVLGFVTQVLNASKSLQDYLALLPEHLHTTVLEVIKNCPCKECFLTQQQIELIKDKNSYGVSLLKQRLVRNLLI